MSQKASQGSVIKARMEVEIIGVNHHLERAKAYFCLSEL